MFPKADLEYNSSGKERGRERERKRKEGKGKEEKRKKEGKSTFQVERIECLHSYIAQVCC